MLPGDGHSLISLTFSRSMFNSFEEVTKPKYMSFVFIKELFFRFINNFLVATFSLLLSNVLSVLHIVGQLSGGEGGG
jgi:hypothetical protein